MQKKMILDQNDLSSQEEKDVSDSDQMAQEEDHVPGNPHNYPHSISHFVIDPHQSDGSSLRDTRVRDEVDVDGYSQETYRTPRLPVMATYTATPKPINANINSPNRTVMTMARVVISLELEGGEDCRQGIWRRDGRG